MAVGNFEYSRSRCNLSHLSHAQKELGNTGFGDFSCYLIQRYFYLYPIKFFQTSSRRSPIKGVRSTDGLTVSATGLSHLSHAQKESGNTAFGNFSCLFVCNRRYIIQYDLGLRSRDLGHLAVMADGSWQL